MGRKFENAISAILILMMVAVAILQVVARYGLTGVLELFWTEEFARLLLVWLTFWGATVVQRSADHIAVPIIYDILPNAVKLPIRLLGDIVVLVVLGCLGWYGWTAAQLSLDQQTIVLGVTIAVFAYPVPICAALMIGYTLYGMWRRIQGRPLESETTEA